MQDNTQGLIHETHKALLGFVGLCTLVLVLFVVLFGRYGEAITADLGHGVGEATFSYAKKLESMGNHDQAILLYRQALDGRFQKPDNQALCALSLADLLYQRGRYVEAVEAYQNVPAKSFERPGTYPGYIEALRRLGDDTTAERLGLRWLELAEGQEESTQMLWASMALAQIYEARKEYDPALIHFRKAAALDPSSDANILVARTLRWLGFYQEASAHLEKVLADESLKHLHPLAAQWLSEMP